MSGSLVLQFLVQNIQSDHRPAENLTRIYAKAGVRYYFDPVSDRPGGPSDTASM